VLGAARESAAGRVIAVVQPHRYTRLRDLMGEFQAAFADADIVFAAPVYPAGEAPIGGVDSAALIAGMSHPQAAQIDGPDDLARRLAGLVQPGDMVVCLGAGDITKWAAGLAGNIAQCQREMA
jgi:UDP-N-acetylmuramate--alanine ligase